MLRRRPVTGGAAGGSEGAELSAMDSVFEVDAAVCGRFFSVFRLKKDLFLRIVFRRSARCSWRMDSAMVEAAVRTVLRRSSGSTASFSSSVESRSSGFGCLRWKMEDMYAVAR